MRVFRLTVIVMIVFVAALFAADWSAAQQGQPWQGGQRGPRMMCADRFVSMDTSKDGQVDADEFMAFPHRRDDAQQIFTSMDTNGDGVVTKDEFCAGKGRRGGRRQ